MAPRKPRNFSPKHRSANGRTFLSNDWGKMYDGAWEDYRKRFLKENQKCYNCGVPATVVDHLRPHQGNEVIFKQLDNHIPLCETCHNRVTALFDRKFKTGGSIENKIKFFVANRAAKELTFRVRVLASYASR